MCFRMRAFQNYFILCGVQPAIVIYSEAGQTLYLAPETTVEEVLQSHPHHFICQQPQAAAAGRFSDQQQAYGGGNQIMLSLDTELESGCIYFLLPLPKLFPSSEAAAPSSSAACTSCACFSQYNNNYCNKLEIISKLGSSPDMEHLIRTSSPASLKLAFRSSPDHRAAAGGSSPSFRSSKLRNLSLARNNSRVLPEYSDLYSRWNSDNATAAEYFLRRRRKKCDPWRPGLSRISEEEDLELALDQELKMNMSGVKPHRVISTGSCKARTHHGGTAGAPLVGSRPSSNISVSASVFG